MGLDYGWDGFLCQGESVPILHPSHARSRAEPQADGQIWNVDMPKTQSDLDVAVEGEGDVILYALSKLIAVPTVSDEAHRESCRQGAHLLRKLLSQLGAEATIVRHRLFSPRSVACGQC